MLNSILRYKGFVLTLALNLILGVAILSIIIFSFNKVNSLRSQINIEKEQVTTLSNRLEDLKKSQEYLNSDNVSLVSNLLPPKNSTLLVSSQIRNLAEENGITFENYNLSIIPSTEDTLPEVNININANGNYDKMINFVDGLRMQAPMLILETAEIDTRENQTTANLTLGSYWSEFPLTLPSINQPISTLDDQELQLMAKIGDFILPKFQSENFSVKAPVVPRINPYYFEDETPLTSAIQEIPTEEEPIIEETP
jgi:Tfp pilus assembly protein PilO